MINFMYGLFTGIIVTTLLYIALELFILSHWNCSFRNGATDMAISVHDAHCCKKHGCKYGDDDCPVVLGIEPGVRECEYCAMESTPSEMAAIPHIDDNGDLHMPTATPRCDLASVKMERLDGDIEELVAADFARTLERENAELRRQLAAIPEFHVDLKEHLRHVGDANRQAETARADALEEAAKVADTSSSHVASAIRALAAGRKG